MVQNNYNNKQRTLQTGQIGWYVPHKMWVTLVAFFSLSFVMREDLIERFQSHVSLNGLILTTMMVVVVMAFNNIFHVQRAANLLKRIENFEDNPAAQVQGKLVKELRGSYIDNYYFQQRLSNYEIGKDEFVKFDDKQAMLIKSKVGFRSNNMRNTVQYLAGVLVMLGLIGTFWGLLETITAVGQAMGSLTGDLNEEGSMESFLAAISKPLQGMGVAFSASLFGLSGSLLGGLLNSFCGKGMNDFIEHFGIWIDTRIPQVQQKPKAELNPAELIEQHNKTVVAALEDVLTGLRKQSQTMFVQLTEVMTEFSRFSQQQQTALSVISNESKVNVRLADSMEQAVFGLKQEAQLIRERVVSLPEIHQSLGNDVRHVANIIADSQDSISQHIVNSSVDSNKTRTTLNSLLESYAAMVSLMERLIQQDKLEKQAPETTSQIIMEMQQVLKQQLDAANQPISLKVG